MILSAGMGTRLSPYTDTLPKALVPYKNVPMIKYQIDRLIKIGVDEIIINAHHHSQKIIDYFNNNFFDIKTHVVVEEKILGTGGGILNAKDFLENENFFCVINVDVDTNIDLEKMVIHHTENNPIATLAVQKRKTSRFLEFDHSMKLLGRADENSDVNLLFAFNGIHLISSKIFEKDIKVEYKDILEIYFKIINDKKEFISGYNVGDELRFKDLGRAENLFS